MSTMEALKAVLNETPMKPVSKSTNEKSRKINSKKKSSKTERNDVNSSKKIKEDPKSNQMLNGIAKRASSSGISNSNKTDRKSENKVWITDNIIINFIILYFIY